MLTIDASDYLMDLIFQALDHGIDSLRAQNMTPFVITVEGGARTLRRFVKPTAAEALEAAAAWVAAQPLETTHYALGYEIVLTVDDADVDALLVEGGQRGQSDAFLFAQRYVTTADQTLRTVGDPAYMGTALQRLT